MLQTPCAIGLAFNPLTQAAPPAKPFTAIWDTGATNSVLSQKVIDDCGLTQTGLAEVHGVNSVTMEPTFLVSIQLPSGVAYAEVQVTRGTLPHSSHVLIGMDIIATGDFVITNKDGVTWWSFCWPSTRRTDYVAEHAAGARQQQNVDHGHGPRPRRHK